MPDNLGTLVIDPHASRADVDAALAEVNQVLSRRGYMLQVGNSKTSRSYVMVLCRVLSIGEAVAVAEVYTINPTGVSYRMFGETTIRKADSIA